MKRRYARSETGIGVVRFGSVFLPPGVFVQRKSERPMVWIIREKMHVLLLGLTMHIEHIDHAKENKVLVMLGVDIGWVDEGSVQRTGWG